MSFWWGQSPFDESIEQATSELLPAGQENLALNLEIADQIRGKKVNAKEAMRSLKTRLSHKNPNVQLLTLSLVDCCVKNGGEHFVKEVATREFMEELTSIIRAPTGCNLDVKNKILAIVQVWGMASKGNPQLSYITDTYNFLKAEGYVFPPVNEHTDSIVLESSAAPEWSDSDVCERCRTTFTMTNRKHHCRQCGKTFCGQCSAKTMPLPHLAITEDVRVCDGCYMKNTLSRIEKKEAAASSNSLPSYMQGSSLPKQGQQRSSSISKPPVSSGNDDDMDDDLKKAIELSLKEAEQSKSSYGAGYVAPQKVERKPSPQATAATPTDDLEDDPDLAAAIAASLQDMQISQNQASQSRGYRGPSSNDLSTVEMENILLFSTLIDRIRVSSGEVGNDPQVNALYTQIGAIQPKLVKTLDDTMRKHHTFVDLHAKLNQAVKMYDRLLEERLNSTYARNSHPSHERVQSPHQYYASPAAPHTGYTPTGDQNSIYPNATNYNQTQASFPQASTYDHSESGYAGGQPQPSSEPYMYNAPSSAPYMPSYSAPQHSGSAPPPPQDYNVHSQPPSTAPPQDYQSIPTPQGTAPPQPGYMPAQGYFPPEQATSQSPQDSYYPPPTQETAPPPSHYAPPNEYQPGPPQGYVSPPASNAQSAPMYAPEAYYPPQQAPPQPEVASPHQQHYGPPSQAPLQQRWDGYPQQPYPQQHDRSGYPVPSTAPAQHQQPPVEEAPLIEL
ncbi:Vacuolar protein-sorting-associated protein 27 [Umbelopsis sp. WA50703]